VRPLAVYADTGGAAASAGAALLEEAGFEVRVLGSVDAAAIARDAAGATALLVSAATVDGELLAALPELRIVAAQSVGIDHVDVAAATARGIWVSNVPAVATEEVAVHAFAMGLSLLRGLPWFDRAVRAGRWFDVELPLRRPSEITLGVCGLGRIGARVAALGVHVYGRVIGADPLVADPPPGVERVDLDELLRGSDVLSLHLPLTSETHHLLDAAALARMRTGAIVVNVSRGALIDPAALLAALDGGQIGGAALDVFETEPPEPGDPLVAHPRVISSPHSAYYSDRTALAYVVEQARNVVAWWEQGRPLTPVAELSVAFGSRDRGRGPVERSSAPHSRE
jgi:phosphoglycerate dehydrogenase-like enzyme